MNICVIGCGTYGSYLIRRLLETAGPDVRITALEVGDDRTRSGEEIGIPADSPQSRAPHHGRYFGLGGTSARWGGQILFFDERDNPGGDPDWAEIVARNRRHRDRVLTTLLGPGPYARLMDDSAADAKTGVWLKYGKRNLYRQLTKAQRERVTIVRNGRATGFETAGDTVTAVRWVDDRGVASRIEADRFYLTAGAFESCRILLGYAACYRKDLGRNYGDHISTELFEIKGRPPVLDGIDLTPRFFRGSLITKRLVVRTASGRVGFAHAIVNKHVKVFSDLKAALFGRKAGRFRPWSILAGTEFLVRFAWNMLVRRRLYVHRNVWSLQLDLEQAFPNINTVGLAPARDRFGESVVRVNWAIDDADRREIDELRTALAERLRRAGFPIDDAAGTSASDAKVEDVYHPSGLVRMGSDDDAVVDMDCAVRGRTNLYHFSTAMFPSARSINPTAAAFCLIEEHLTRTPSAATRPTGPNP
jgi:hypothetical protein